MWTDGSLLEVSRDQSMWTRESLGVKSWSKHLETGVAGSQWELKHVGGWSQRGSKHVDTGVAWGSNHGQSMWNGSYWGVSGGQSMQWLGSAESNHVDTEVAGGQCGSGWESAEVKSC